MIEKEQVAPVCVTVNVCPAIVIVPVRELPVLAATVKATAPLPEPLSLPGKIVIQTALLAAVHAQPCGALTPTAPLPPLAPKDWLDGVSE